MHLANLIPILLGLLTLLCHSDARLLGREGRHSTLDGRQARHDFSLAPDPISPPGALLSLLTHHPSSSPIDSSTTTTTTPILSSRWDLPYALHLTQLVSASYCRDHASLALWNCTRCLDLPSFLPHTIINDSTWNLFAYVGYSPDISSIVVVFRGTDSMSLVNWISDMSSWRTGLDMDLDGSSSTGGGGSDDDNDGGKNVTGPILVHSGFFRAYNESSLKPGVRDAVMELLAEHGARTSLVITGHSLGGALADFCALDLLQYIKYNQTNTTVFGRGKDGMSSDASSSSSSSSSSRLRPLAPSYRMSDKEASMAASFSGLLLDPGEDDPDIKTYTLGSPRVGNERFVHVFTRLVQSTVRLTHGRDVVPSLPYQLLGFRHVPWEIFLVDVARSDGSVVELAQVCDGSGEDGQCHDGACLLGLCTSIDDHLRYLNVFLGQGDDC